MQHSPCVVAVLFGLVVDAVVAGQTMPRTIPYDRNVPIAQRLVAGDTEVIVAKASMPPLVGMSDIRESLDQEIRRLAGYDTVALVQVLDSDGELADGGTWIRTRVRARATQLLKTGALVGQDGLTEFWEDGGSTKLGTVVVTAGIYQQTFTVQQSYLVFLRTARSSGTTYAALAFHLDSNNTLRAMKRADGSEITPRSSLIGRSISDVAAAFSRAK